MEKELVREQRRLQGEAEIWEAHERAEGRQKPERRLTVDGAAKLDEWRVPRWPGEDLGLLGGER